MFGQVSINDISVKTPEIDGVQQCVVIDNDRNKIICTEDASNKTTAELLASVWSTGSGNLPVEKSTAIVESVGMFLFGIYHVVIIIVLINMLIAMMSHSFEDIQVNS